MNDYEVVVVGLRTMLEPHADRVNVVEMDSRLPVASDVDVVLYDGFSRERVTGPFRAVVEECSAPVVLYTWHLQPDLVAESLAAGVSGCVSKTASAADLLDALERVARGETVVSPDPGPDAVPLAGDWPGKALGLTARESEVMALIAQGLSNKEVAERAYISLNSLKTHIRSAYRKIGVERRSQAVLWAAQNGFLPATMRVVLEDDGS